MPAGVIIAAVVGSVVSAGLSYAMRPGAPDDPDLAGASRGQIEAEAETLAARRALESAAQQGGSAVRQGYSRTTVGAQERARLQSEIEELQYRVENPPTRSSKVQRDAWEAQLEDLQDRLVNIPEGGGTVYVDANNRIVPESEATVSFEGYGEADVQGKIARDMSEIELELSRKYGKDFVEEARRQLELSDPEGTAARRSLYDLIQRQIEDDPDRPVADLLEGQVSEQLAAGRGLDRVSQEMLDQAVAEAQGSRGERGMGGTDFSEPLTTGFEGQSRLDAGQQKALSWLTSGATPEDVDYRREQQNLANLSAFTAGRTPQSQFQNLSGAQTGPAPNYRGQPLPLANPNAGAAGEQAALSSWNIQSQDAMNQVNPWMAGLSVLLRGAGAAGAAGWKPLARGV